MRFMENKIKIMQIICLNKNILTQLDKYFGAGNANYYCNACGKNICLPVDLVKHSHIPLSHVIPIIQAVKESLEKET